MALAGAVPTGGRLGALAATYADAYVYVGMEGKDVEACDQRWDVSSNVVDEAGDPWEEKKKEKAAGDGTAEGNGKRIRHGYDNND